MDPDCPIGGKAVGGGGGSNVGGGRWADGNGGPNIWVGGLNGSFKSDPTFDSAVKPPFCWWW